MPLSTSKLPRDWRELPAGRDLDKVVAAAVGWTEIVETQLLIGTTPAGFRTMIPFFSQDLNSAYSLLTEVTVINITKTGVGNIFVDLWQDNGHDCQYKSEQPEPLALAICRARLSYIEKYSMVKPISPVAIFFKRKI